MKTMKLFGLMALALGALACQNDFDDEKIKGEVDGTPIEFVVGEENRALLDLEDGKSVTWEAGDQLGVIYHVNGAVSTSTPNLAYTTEAGGNVATFAGNGVWEGSKNDTHNFYVYYPYREDSTADLVKISLTSAQTYDAKAGNWAVGEKYGFAYAKVENAEFGKPIQIGKMQQYLAVLRLNITNNTGEDITIKTVATKASLAPMASWRVDLTKDGDIFKESKDAKSTITTTVKNGFVAAGESIDVRVSLLPRDYTNKDFTITITAHDGTEYPAITFKGGNIVPGGRAVKAIALNAVAEEPVDVSTLNIFDTCNGGLVYWIAEDKSSCKVLYPYGKKLKWSDTAARNVTAATSSDGAENVAAMKAYAEANSLDFHTTFPAASYCDMLVGDWYLPSSTELHEMFKLYNGTNKDKATSATPSGITAEEKAKRDAFDAALLAAFSDGLLLNTQAETSNGDSAWGSNQYSASNAYYFRWGKVAINNGGKTGTDRYARCVKEIKTSAAAGGEEELTPISDEYDVFLLIGQSNMAGRGEMIEGDDASIEGVYLLNGSDEPEVASNPLNKYSTIRKDISVQGINPGFSFSQEIYKEIKNSGRKVLLVVNARGETGIGSWKEGVLSTVSGLENISYYNEAVRRTKEAMRYGTLKAILWHQGESNSSSPENYVKTHLKEVVADLRDDLGNVPFIAGEIAPWHKNKDKFNPIIQTISEHIDNADYVTSEGCTPLIDESDPHFDRDSQILLGQRYAEKVLKMAYGK